jgi:hypothetical protein
MESRDHQRAPFSVSLVIRNFSVETSYLLPAVIEYLVKEIMEGHRLWQRRTSGV